MKETNYDLSVNKLIILFMLDKIHLPMSYTYLSEFILNHEYTNYFSLQYYLSELVETKLVITENMSHTTRYSITEQGKKTLEYFENRVPDSMKESVMNYLENNKIELKKEYEITADYTPEKNGDYTVHCLAKDKKNTLIEIKIMTLSKKHAVKICDNWKKNSHTIYGNLLSNLMK